MTIPIWQKTGYNNKNTGQSIYSSLNIPEQKWELNDSLLSNIVIGYDSTIYASFFSDGSSFIRAINSDGSLKWEYDTTSISISALSSLVISGNGNIYCASLTNIISLSSSGTLNWGVARSPSAISPPSISLSNDGLTIYITLDFYVAAYNSSTGALKFISANYGDAYPFQSLAIGSSGIIYSSGFDGSNVSSLLALNSNLTLNWKFSTNNISFIDSPSVATDGTIYFHESTLDNQNFLYAINSNGTLKWKCNLNIIGLNYIYTKTSIAVTSGVIYYPFVSSNKLYISAVNSNGTLKWKYEDSITPIAFLTHIFYASITINGVIYIIIEDSSGYGNLTYYAINSDGTLKWKHYHDGPINSYIFAEPVINNDKSIYLPFSNMIALGEDQSSSSSSSYEPTADLYSVMISQGHNDIIPFSFTLESGFQDSSVLTFTVSGDSLLGSINSVSSGTSYIPENPNAKYKHDPFTYVDIMAKDSSGIKQVSARSQFELYQYEDPSFVFNVPKFSWDNNIFNDDSSSESSEERGGYVWVGTEDKKIYQIAYTTEFAMAIQDSNATSEVYKLLFSPYNSDMYVSGYDNMTRYISNNYWKNTSETKKFIEIANPKEDLIVYAGNASSIVSVESYLGKVIIRDKNTLATISEQSGFDAPFKVIRSAYHGFYLVSGTNLLWKLTDSGIKKSVYEAKGFSILDIDCSQDGRVCILLNSQETSLIRILDKDLYTILFEEILTNEVASFCKYCGNGIFYVLSELKENNGNSYTANHYVFNIDKKTSSVLLTSNDIVTTTTTTTMAPISQKVLLKSPVGGETWQKGTTQNIQWASSASIKDEVSIELYKGKKIADTISSSNTNTGSFAWEIANSYSNASDYKIKITWLAPGDSSNYSMSNLPFTLTDIEVTTTTTTTKIQDRAIGIDYSEDNNLIVVVLRNGLIGLFDINANNFYGLFDSGVRNVLSLGVKDGLVKRYPTNSKVRVFVGSELYLNDMWDSGEIETDLNSIYYGGGGNLIPGERYYINLQTFSDAYGWSEVQTKEFIMPK